MDPTLALSKAFREYVFYLRFIGINVLGGSRWKSLPVLVHRLAVASAIGFYGFSAIWPVIASRGQMEAAKVGEGVLNLIAMSHIMTKYLSLAWKSKQVGFSIQAVQELTDEVVCGEKRAGTEFVERARRYSHYLLWAPVVYISSVVALACISTTLTNILNGTSNLPLFEYCPFGESQLPLCFIFQVLVMFMPAANVFLAVTLLASCVMQMTAALQYMTTVLQSEEVGVEDKEGLLEKFISHHQAIVRLTSVLNQIYGFPLFFEVVVSSLQCCLGIYMAKRTDSGPWDFILGISVLFLPAASSWCGNELEQKNDEFFNALYSSGWFQMRLKSQKTSLIWMSGYKPLNLHFMLFYTFDLPMFRRVIEAAYSYFTLLSSME